MNLFKKALVATAIVASFGASATATISSTPLQMSAEGVAQGGVALNENLVFDVVVGTLHPSASTITLTFDSSIDLDNLAGGAVINDPAEGTGKANDVAFDYGTGSFTFDNVVIDTATAGAHTISFDVNLGNPLTANSAFRIYLGSNVALAGNPDTGVDKVDISGASTVAYSSVTSADVAIETGSGVIAEETSQFAFSVTTPLNEIITRDNYQDFVGAAVGADALVMSMTNNETLAAAIDAMPKITLSGDFTASTLTNGTIVGPEIAASSSVNGGDAAAALATAEDLATADEIGLLFTPGDEFEVTATATTITAAFDNAAGGATDIPVTGDVTATLSIISGTVPVGGAITAFDVATNVAAGEWALDATVINIPYFPVGFTGLSTSVHFANESSLDADVIVSAIGADGTTTYGPLDLGKDLPMKEVTKVSQTEIMALFGITGSEKLSVTFNIDADDGDVNAYSFSNAGDARQSLVTSQQKGQ